MNSFSHTTPRQTRLAFSVSNMFTVHLALMPVSQSVFSRWKSVSNSVIFCWQNKTCWSDRSRLLRAHVDLSDLINFHHTHSSQIKLIFNFFSFSSVSHKRMLHQLHYIKFQSHFSRSLFPFELLFSLLTFSALLMHMQSMKLTKYSLSNLHYLWEFSCTLGTLPPQSSESSDSNALTSAIWSQSSEWKCLSWSRNFSCTSSSRRSLSLNAAK